MSDRKSPWLGIHDNKVGVEKNGDVSMVMAGTENKPLAGIYQDWLYKGFERPDNAELSPEKQRALEEFIKQEMEREGQDLQFYKHLGNRRPAGKDDGLIEETGQKPDYEEPGDLVLPDERDNLEKQADKLEKKQRERKRQDSSK